MPADELEGFFDREQLLAGSPARRAATLLFLVEVRTARLAELARRRLERSATGGAEEERGLAFVEAFALVRESAVAPSIHELERQAARWAPLVPDNPRLRAALARKLGEKHRFTAEVAPGIVRALGLGSREVREEFRVLFGEPAESVFAEKLTPAERLRWAWTKLTTRLENLPPFWTAYSLTLTETVGASILALPIAFASLGPLPGIAIVVVLGLVNVLTVWLMAEAVARSGPMRYGNAFLGRLVEGYLGRAGGLGLSALLTAFAFIALPVYYVGIGSTLEGVTSVPAAVWVAAVFLATLFFVRRGSLNATVGAALAVGAVNLLLVLGLVGIAFAHLHGSNLTHTEVPFTGGRPFESSVVAVVFGVVLMGFFGHLSAAMCGSLVLERDPSGRSLVRGCASAQATAAVVYCLFVLGASGAVGARGLTGASGTALGPLAQVGGVGVDILGSAFVLLALGMISILEAVALFGLTQERIPSLAPRIVVLPRRRGHLVFRARRLRAGLTYLGPGANGFRFALDLDREGSLERTEVVASGRSDLLAADEPGGHRLALEVLDADDRRARVAVTTTLRASYEGGIDTPGFDLGEALALPEEEAALAALLLRSGPLAAAAAAEALGTGEQAALAMLERLVERGTAEVQQTPDGQLFSGRVAARRARTASVWQSLAEGPGALRPEAGGARDLRTVLFGRRGRFVLSIVPLATAFALGEWFVLADIGSFTGLLGFLGVIVVSLVAGMLPVLLFLSSRRKGEYAPATSSRLLSHPVVLAAVYLVFVVGLFAHGLVIWDDPAQRAAALAAGVAMLAIPVVLARSGAFARRLTIEVRDDQRSGSATVELLSGDRSIAGDVGLEYDGDGQVEVSPGQVRLGALRRAVVGVRRDQASLPDEVKVWVHRVTPEGESESLQATARVLGGGDARAADLSLSRGEAVFPFAELELEIEISLKEAGRSARRPDLGGGF